jgi:hypothetical protein
MSTRKQYSDITEPVDEIAEEINAILNDCQKEKYFYGIVLLYSFIENLLKWLVFVTLLWDKSVRDLREEEVTAVQQYCKRLTFYNAQQIALAVDVIDWRLFRRIDAIRTERNDVVHQFWLYTHRGNRLVLRKKLEKLARVANDLVGQFNSLTEEIEVDETYEIFL